MEENTFLKKLHEVEDRWNEAREKHGLPKKEFEDPLAKEPKTKPDATDEEASNDSATTALVK